MTNEPPPMSMSPIYEDDRWPDPYAISVRGHSIIKIYRYRTREEAQVCQEKLQLQGYIIHPLTR